MSFILAGAAIGAGLNYLSSLEEQKNIDKRKSLLEESKISATEKASMLRDLNRSFNSEIANTQNAMALNSRGTDSSLALSAFLGTAAGSKIKAESDLRANIAGINRGINSQISGMQDTNTTSAIVGGAIEGGIAGAQISELLKNPAPKAEDLLEPIQEPAKIIGETPSVKLNNSTDIFTPNSQRDLAGVQITNEQSTEPETEIKTGITDIKGSIYDRHPGLMEFRPGKINEDGVKVIQGGARSELNLDRELDTTNERELYLAGRMVEGANKDAIAPYEAYTLIKAIPALAKAVIKNPKILSTTYKQVYRGVKEFGDDIGYNIGRFARGESAVDDVAEGIASGIDDFAAGYSKTVPVRSSQWSPINGPSYNGAYNKWNPVKRYVTPPHLDPEIMRGQTGAFVNFTMPGKQKLLIQGEYNKVQDWVKGDLLEGYYRPWLKGKGFRRLN